MTVKTPRAADRRLVRAEALREAKPDPGELARLMDLLADIARDWWLKHGRPPEAPL